MHFKCLVLRGSLQIQESSIWKLWCESKPGLGLHDKQIITPNTLGHGAVKRTMERGLYQYFLVIYVYLTHGITKRHQARVTIFFKYEWNCTKTKIDKFNLQRRNAGCDSRDDFILKCPVEFWIYRTSFVLLSVTSMTRRAWCVQTLPQAKQQRRRWPAVTLDGVV